MSGQTINGVRLHYEEQGSGHPILCVHGTGSSALVWESAIPELARFGRVISYDRRGCTRSERPEPYLETSVHEHADDAAALLDALAASPATVVGRSYGAEVGIDLALRHSDRVRALVLLEPGAAGLSPAYTEWERAVAERVRGAADRDGVGATAEALIGEVLGPGAWGSFPDQLQQMFTDNGSAILAELRGGELPLDAAALVRIEQPVLLVTASDSPPMLRELADGIADALPNVRVSQVGGGHMIDPAGPDVLRFLGALASP
jgi:pimeloyl-ACP methyl ester carboxylesterase